MRKEIVTKTVARFSVLLIAYLAFVGLFAVGCGKSTLYPENNGINSDGDSDIDSDSDGHDDSDSNSDSDSDGDTDTATDTDVGIEPHCIGEVTEPTICLENVSGHAGDVVKVDAYLMLPIKCHAVKYAGVIDFDETEFTLTNATNGNVESQCGRRMMLENNIDWWHTNSTDYSNCPSCYQSGVGETFEMKIGSSTSPGDYMFTLLSSPYSYIVGIPYDSGCDSQNVNMPGTLRVLP